jgi:hypothetical protein
MYTIHLTLANFLAYVILEDLTHHFKKPCIMDIKIGIQSFGEDADPVKKQKMREKDEQTTTVSLGFRITALNVINEFATLCDIFRSLPKQANFKNEESHGEKTSKKI